MVTSDAARVFESFISSAMAVLKAWALCLGLGLGSGLGVGLGLECELGLHLCEGCVQDLGLVVGVRVRSILEQVFGGPFDRRVYCCLEAALGRQEGLPFRVTIRIMLRVRIRVGVGVRVRGRYVV